MKRGSKGGAWPKGIVEIPAARLDPRADPQATQKISREQLDEALMRTKSGTRPAMRSDVRRERDEREDDDDDAFGGPRDDSPQITIVRIDSMELETIDPSSLPPPSSTADPPSARRMGLGVPSSASAFTPLTHLAHPPASLDASLTHGDGRRSLTQGLRAFRPTPRLVLAAAIAVSMFVALAALIGFLAGRLTH